MSLRRGLKSCCWYVFCIALAAVSCFQLGLWTATVSNQSTGETTKNKIEVINFETEIKQSLQGKENVGTQEISAQYLKQKDWKQRLLHQSINDNLTTDFTREKSSSSQYGADSSLIQRKKMRPVIDRMNSPDRKEISELEEHYGRHKMRYVKFEEKDNPKMGDFTCMGSVSTTSCVFKFSSVPKAAIYCESMGPYCKGFVKSLSNDGKLIVYFKNKVGILKPNTNTDFYVKKEFYEKVRFQE